MWPWIPGLDLNPGSVIAPGPSITSVAPTSLRGISKEWVKLGPGQIGGRHLGDIQLTGVTVTPTHLMEGWHDGCGTLDTGSPGRLPRPTPMGKAGLPGEWAKEEPGVWEEAEATPWLTLGEPIGDLSH